MPTQSTESSIVQTADVAEIQAAVRNHTRLWVRGGGSKPALSTPPEDSILLDLRQVTGVLAYEPGEFTFTARSATPIAEVQAMLAAEGQYLPFDPLLAQRGATLGGVVASGTAGPGRYRFGGVRDFLIGVRFVDGLGNLVRGGGQVVKNAAGFDLPKLMVGSLGRLGILVELSFKVFPHAPAHATLRLALPNLAQALETLDRLAGGPLELDALDLVPGSAGAILWIRMAGLASALPDRMQRLRALLEGGDILDDDAEPRYWQEMSQANWVAGDAALIRVPLTPARIPLLESTLPAGPVQRRYSVGGNLAWIAWPHTLDDLDRLLTAQNLAGLVLLGPSGRPWLGRLPGAVLGRRVKAALDPDHRFPPF